MKKFLGLCTQLVCIAYCLSAPVEQQQIIEKKARGSRWGFWPKVIGTAALASAAYASGYPHGMAKTTMRGGFLEQRSGDAQPRRLFWEGYLPSSPPQQGQGWLKVFQQSADPLEAPQTQMLLMEDTLTPNQMGETMNQALKDISSAIAGDQQLSLAQAAKDSVALADAVHQRNPLLIAKQLEELKADRATVEAETEKIASIAKSIAALTLQFADQEKKNNDIKFLALAALCVYGDVTSMLKGDVMKVAKDLETSNYRDVDADLRVLEGDYMKTIGDYALVLKNTGTLVNSFANWIGGGSEGEPAYNHLFERFVAYYSNRHLVSNGDQLKNEPTKEALELRKHYNAMFNSAIDMLEASAVGATSLKELVAVHDASIRKLWQVMPAEHKHIGDLAADPVTFLGRMVDDSKNLSKEQLADPEMQAALKALTALQTQLGTIAKSNADIRSQEGAIKQFLAAHVGSVLSAFYKQLVLTGEHWATTYTAEVQASVAAAGYITGDSGDEKAKELQEDFQKVSEGLAVVVDDVAACSKANNDYLHQLYTLFNWETSPPQPLELQ